ncbi:cell surface glycoprotein 1, partial [Plakobranchus ocellatus]
MNAIPTITTNNTQHHHNHQSPNRNHHYHLTATTITFIIIITSLQSSSLSPPHTIEYHHHHTLTTSISITATATHNGHTTYIATIIFTSITTTAIHNHHTTNTTFNATTTVITTTIFFFNEWVIFDTIKSTFFNLFGILFRSTPLFDEVYGGQDDLTAAFGYEENGETTILFRKKLTANEQTDWTIENGLMHVAWARGQQMGDVVHRPNSAIETNEADDMYYRPDELKYHGHGTHRGAASFNFFDPPPEAIVDCTTGGCTDPDSCPYTVTWVYNQTTDSVTFDIKADVATNQWVALGFSRDNQMPQTDIVAVYVLPGGDGVPTVSD